MKRITGYVATLDVLGFADLLYRDGYTQQLVNYLNMIDNIVRPAHVRAEVVVFSDSVVLTAPGDSDEAFSGLVRACAAAFHAMLMVDLPVRGAVAFGHYWRQTSGGSVFLAGRPIVEAYRFERAQKWVGIALCPSVLHKRTDLRRATRIPRARGTKSNDSSLRIRLRPATVPFQEPGASVVGELSGYAIVPLDTDDDIQTAVKTIQRTRTALEELRLRAPSPGAQSKYRASIAWLTTVQEEIGSVLPSECAPKRSGPPTRG